MKPICYSLSFLIAALLFLNSSFAFADEKENFITILVPCVVADVTASEKSGCKAGEEKAPEATVDDEDELSDDFFDEYDKAGEKQTIADPLYYFNYAMYQVNDKIYYFLLKPVARGYRFITPEELRMCVRNFFHNLLFPVRFVNNIFQGKMQEAGNEVGIFLLNSTVGGLGVAQVAQDHFGLQTSNEDLGQTLGSYNIGNGFYLVLPVLGPSTLRDAVGRVGDYFITPINYVEPWELAAGIKAYETINDTTFRIGDYEALQKASLDPYVAFRDAYIQNRNQKIKE
ncbi:MAG: VacJ family lipoprotein [Desulfobacteraceae bacterium]|nr:VacJ family lipoprotein [Desulfobacteraceae bacterium]